MVCVHFSQSFRLNSKIVHQAHETELDFMFKRPHTLETRQMTSHNTFTLFSPIFVWTFLEMMGVEIFISIFHWWIC